MATMGQRIKELRLSLGMTQGALADALRISKSAVGMYETDKREPDNKTLDCIADFFNVDMDYLYGKSDIKNKYEWWKAYSNSIDPYTDINLPSNIIPMPTMRKIPLVGNIACGEPILAEQNIECEVNIPDNIRADFALRCEGESMIDVDIHEGDIVYIRKQDMVDNGQIAAVLINETCDEARATLKRVYYNREIGELRLVPENRREPTRVFTGEDLNSIRILGLAVGLTRSLEDK